MKTTKAVKVEAVVWFYSCGFYYRGRVDNITKDGRKSVYHVYVYTTNQEVTITRNQIKKVMNTKAG